MENILLVINIILAAILVILVLLQKSEGGALGIGVSQDNFMFARSAGNFMTKATAIVATLFIICSLSLTILSRGDAPESNSISINIEAEHPEHATIAVEQLLSGSWDIDGDQLNIKNVRGSKGEATTQNPDGSWNIVTNGDNGDYTLLFDVTDGELSTEGKATITVNHQPVFCTFDFVSSSIEVREGLTSHIEVHRSGNLVTKQIVHVELKDGDITNQDIQLGKAVFEKGSSRALIDIELLSGASLTGLISMLCVVLVEAP